MSTSPLEILSFSEKNADLLDDILSFTGRKSAGWHYCLDYAFALGQFDPEKHQKILDIGCGPTGNALHDYIEKKFGIEVMGLDRLAENPTSFSWPRRLLRRALGRVDHEGGQIDYNSDLMEFETDGWDLIVAISSLEHNQPDATKACWQHAQSLLSENGTMVATFSIAGDNITKWNDDTHATDLSVDDAEHVWAAKFEGNMPEIISSYDHPYMRERYFKRFGQTWASAPCYLAGAVVKGNN